MLGFFFWTAVGAACATAYYNASHKRSSSGRLGRSSGSSESIGSTTVGSSSAGSGGRLSGV